MKKYITLPDGTKCYSFPNCRKHKTFFSDSEQTNNQKNTQNNVKLSKTISYILRHKPEEAGLTPDDQGWVKMEDLVHGLNTNFPQYKKTITPEVVYSIVAADNKQRYSVQGNKIRAAQGHSYQVDLGLKPSIPPKFLYHGTTVTTEPIIRNTGLKPMSRQQVHLSENYDTATQVGSRHGKVKVLSINAEKAHSQGIKFYKADNGVWLTDFLPAEYID